MEIREISDKNLWENFLTVGEEKTFLQSWNWGEFQKLSGNKIWRLGVYQENELIAIALTIKITAKRGTFLFVPHGPVIKSNINPPAGGQKSKIITTSIEYLKDISIREKAWFIRIAPVWQRSEENVMIFKNLGFRDAPLHLHPELSWELDIRPSEEELLTKMRKTTRYLIKQTEKNSEVEILQSNDLEGLEDFNKLYQETVTRHHFTPFSFDYLKNELLAFKDDNQISIFLGKYKGETIAAAMIIFWAGIGFYHQGASSLKYTRIPVSYLLQWEAIKEAKKRGCRFYNFWGISDINNKKHPWYGLSLFKIGFGGYPREYVKTQDLLLLKKYWLTYVFERARRWKRGL